METQVQCIENWQEYIFAIQKDLLALEEHVSSLHKHKDDAQKDFEKVEGQIEYYFISSQQENQSCLGCN
jgi:hypothetical protein